MSEVIGYVASALVLLTFMTKDMRLLRTIAIASNIAFIAYGALGWLAPILCLHLMLLPLNVVRLRQLQSAPALTPPSPPASRCGAPTQLLRV
jgi:hypothetical protein